MVLVRPIVTDATTTAGLIGVLDVTEPPTEPPVEIRARQLLSPVTTDATIFGQAFNYAPSAAEAARAPRSHMLFTRASSALSGPYDPIIRPTEVELLDYEAEIGVVVRSPLHETTDISDENVGDVIAGVVLCNDVSPRDEMFGATFFQWFMGKSHRTFCPTGPVLYLLEHSEVAPTLGNLEIALSLNGEPRQFAHSSQMIFKPGPTLGYISQWMDVKPGDLLLTGTPAGVRGVISAEVVDALRTHLMDDNARLEAVRRAMSATGPFMRPGDVVSLSMRDAQRALDLGGQQTSVGVPS